MQTFKNDKDLVKVIKSRKRKSTLAKWGYSLPFVLEATAAACSLLRGDVYAFSAFSSGVIFLMCFIEKAKYKNDDETLQFLKDLAAEVGDKIGDKAWELYGLKDITIIPKNIQVGNDMEAINMAPIYKEGKFILMQGDYSLEILAQYEEDGKTVVKILDKEEVKEECSKFDDKLKRKLLIGSNDGSSTSKRVG